MAQSVFHLFRDQVDRRGEATAALVKRSGQYCDVSWNETSSDVDRISRALVAAGVGARDRVCLMAATSYEWCIIDLGVAGAGAVSVPIYASLLADDCRYITDNSGAVLVLAETAQMVDRFLEVKDRLPMVKKVVQISGEVTSEDEWVMSFADLLALGSESVELDERRNALQPSSIYTIMYTSGTTGKPKGVVLTHDSMLYEAEAICEIEIVFPDDVELIWLPLAHVYARALVAGWLGVGLTMAFAESMETIAPNLAEVRPTYMAGVPRVYEKFHAYIAHIATAPGGLKAKFFTAAADLSHRKGVIEAKGGSLNFVDRVKYTVLKKLVFEKAGAGLARLLGGRVRLLSSGGAPLAPHTAYFFRDAGVELVEGYGLTETSAATFTNTPDDNTIGTVGRPMPGTEVRIADDGEILVRGRGVMREYWNSPEDTEEAFEDGWFKTGDIGVLTADGKLVITDRKKDIIVTSAGKNIAPQLIENMVKTNKLISQVVVHGDRRKYLTALITLDPEVLPIFCAKQGWGEGSYAELSQKPEVHAAVQAVIDGCNAGLASFETIKKFKILDHDFSIESGELTPSIKVKRKVVFERYADILNGFYDESTT
jgi:long-chain acyl-CoA synthetase